jgi:hypothetical protein
MRVLAAVAALAVACGCSPSSPGSSGNGGAPQWPDDAALRVKFERQRPDFEKLIAMSNAEPKLIRQSTRGFARVDDFHPGRTPRAKTEADQPQARGSDYQQLFHRLELPNGLQREKAVPPAEQIFFPVYVQQPGSVEKGIAFCDCALPEHPAAELTFAETQAKKPRPIFKRLAPGLNWYLYGRDNSN